MIIKGIILCEGASDQVLLGAYLEKINGWSFVRPKKNFPFQDKNIIFYENSSNEYFAIWSSNGCNFKDAVGKIFELEKYEHTTESLVIITDYDDENAAKERPQAIFRTINEIISLDNYDQDILVKNNNQWQELSYTAGFNRKIKMNFCYLLVPLDSQGALETFMLNALSESSVSRKEVIEQVKVFLRDLKSQVYLKQRRERIKAQLSVSVSVFAPERMFDTFKELISLVDWSLFDETNKQFKVLSEDKYLL